MGLDLRHTGRVLARFILEFPKSKVLFGVFTVFSFLVELDVVVDFRFLQWNRYHQERDSINTLSNSAQVFGLIEVLSLKHWVARLHPTALMVILLTIVCILAYFLIQVFFQTGQDDQTVLQKSRPVKLKSFIMRLAFCCFAYYDVFFVFFNTLFFSSATCELIETQYGLQVQQSINGGKYLYIQTVMVETTLRVEKPRTRFVMINNQTECKSIAHIAILVMTVPLFIGNLLIKLLNFYLVCSAPNPRVLGSRSKANDVFHHSIIVIVQLIQAATISAHLQSQNHFKFLWIFEIILLTADILFEVVFKPVYMASQGRYRLRKLLVLLGLVILTVILDQDLPASQMFQFTIGVLFAFILAFLEKLLRSFDRRDIENQILNEEDLIRNVFTLLSILSSEAIESRNQQFDSSIRKQFLKNSLVDYYNLCQLRKSWLSVPSRSQKVLEAVKKFALSLKVRKSLHHKHGREEDSSVPIVYTLESAKALKTQPFAGFPPQSLYPETPGSLETRKNSSYQLISKYNQIQLNSVEYTMMDGTEDTLEVIDRIFKQKVFSLGNPLMARTPLNDHLLGLLLVFYLDYLKRPAFALFVLKQIWEKDRQEAYLTGIARRKPLHLSIFQHICLALIDSCIFDSLNLPSQLGNGEEQPPIQAWRFTRFVQTSTALKVMQHQVQASVDQKLSTVADLTNSGASLKRLFDGSSCLVQSYKLISSRLNEISEPNGLSYVPAATLYAFYVSFVLHSPIKAIRFLRDATSRSKRFINELVPLFEVEQSRLNELVVMRAGMERENFHKICYSSNNLKKYLLFTREELEGEDLKVIVPEPISSKHEAMFHPRKITGKFLNLDIYKEMPVKRKDGCLSKMSLVLRICNCLEEGVAAISGMVFDGTAANRDCLIVIDENDRVLETSEPACAHFEKNAFLKDYSEDLAATCRSLLPLHRQVLEKGFPGSEQISKTQWLLTCFENFWKISKGQDFIMREKKDVVLRATVFLKVIHVRQIDRFLRILQFIFESDKDSCPDSKDGPKRLTTSEFIKIYELDPNLELVLSVLEIVEHKKQSGSMLTFDSECESKRNLSMGKRGESHTPDFSLEMPRSLAEGKRDSRELLQEPSPTAKQSASQHQSKFTATFKGENSAKGFISSRAAIYRSNLLHAKALKILASRAVFSGLWELQFFTIFFLAFILIQTNLGGVKYMKNFLLQREIDNHLVSADLVSWIVYRLPTFVDSQDISVMQRRGIVDEDLLLPYLNQSLAVAMNDSKVSQLTNNFRYILNTLEHSVKCVAFLDFIRLDKFIHKGNMSVYYINPIYYVQPLKPYKRNWILGRSKKEKVFSFLGGHLQAYSFLELSKTEFSFESVIKSDMMLELFRRNLLDEVTGYVLELSEEVNTFLRTVADRNHRIVGIFGLAAVTITIYILAVSTLALNYWKIKADELNTKLFAVKVKHLHSARRLANPCGRARIDQEVLEERNLRKRICHLCIKI